MSEFAFCCNVLVGSTIVHPFANHPYHLRTTSTIHDHPGGPYVAPWPIPNTGPKRPKKFATVAILKT
eukprot:13401141-Ditylum_brightwellii.AAC.1